MSRMGRAAAANGSAMASGFVPSIAAPPPGAQTARSVLHETIPIIPPSAISSE